MTFIIILILIGIFLTCFLTVRLFDRELNQYVDEGNFFVNGQGSITINLNGRPSSIRVEFGEDTNSHPCHPCNPHHDTLSWDIIESCGKYKLVISFDVDNLKEIIYTVIY